MTCTQARDPSPLNWVRTNWRHWRFQSSSCERIVFLINVSTRLHPNNDCQESRGDDALPTGLSNRIQPGSKPRSKPSQGGVATPGHKDTPEQKVQQMDKAGWSQRVSALLLFQRFFYRALSICHRQQKIINRYFSSSNPLCYLIFARERCVKLLT